jgi:hypothetical protein
VNVCSIIIVNMRELDVQAHEPVSDSSNAMEDRFASVFAQSDIPRFRRINDRRQAARTDRSLAARHLTGGEVFSVDDMARRCRRSSGAP